MFYEPEKKNHGLPHDPFKNLIIPRPIGWIGTYSAQGTSNLAPYSFFNAFSTNPHIIGFSSETVKDSQTNAETSGAFTHHVVSHDLLDRMNITSAGMPSTESEIKAAGLTEMKAKHVDAPLITEAAIAMECIYLQTVVLHDRHRQEAGSAMILGQVVGIHIRDDLINERGLVDTISLRPASRLGYMDYATLEESFTLNRPS